MKTIKMVAKVGDQQVPVGTCKSAQARILVRDDLAAWQDGELILFIRRAHLALLESNRVAWRCKADDHNVSEAEINRRKAWFISFMPLAATTFANRQVVDDQEIKDLSAMWIEDPSILDEKADSVPQMDEPLDTFEVELPDVYVGPEKSELIAASKMLETAEWETRKELRKGMMKTDDDTDHTT